MTASLIGCLGQAHFPSFFWVFVAHPGHASLRSLVDTVMESLHACVGSAVTQWQHFPQSRRWCILQRTAALSVFR